MLLLDLFCGAGGASMGYHRAGFDVVGVDIKPQPRYPFDFVLGDALSVDLSDFDAIHASPPCQRFTAYRRVDRRGIGLWSPDLIAPTRERLTGTGVPWVIENVRGAPLVRPVQLCGSSFGLSIRRHRLFESNVRLSVPPCDHGWQTPRFPHATNRVNDRSTIEIGANRIPAAVERVAMGIDWMLGDELTEALPPIYTEFLGYQLLAAASTLRR